MLSKVIRQAGGFAEIVQVVDTSNQGLDLLATGHVIKRDCSEEIRHVFLPKIDPFVKYPPGTRFEIEMKNERAVSEGLERKRGKTRIHGPTL